MSHPVATFPENLLSLFVEVVLLFALYSGYMVLRNLRDDLEYATTRIFLSSKSVTALKVLMATLVGYAVANLLILVVLPAFIQEMFLRLNLVFLFSGWAYFLATISSITAKTSD